jgi:hypothetical protein
MNRLCRTITCGGIFLVSALLSAERTTMAGIVFIKNPPVAFGQTIPGAFYKSVKPDRTRFRPMPDHDEDVVGRADRLLSEAIARWQEIYGHPNQGTFTITVDWGFVDRSFIGGNAATLATGFDANGRCIAFSVVIAAIPFSSSKGDVLWYLDPDGRTATEFDSAGPIQRTATAWGDKQIEIGRFTSTVTSGDASNGDLLTAFMHEMTHGLGLTGVGPLYDRYANEHDGWVDIVPWRVLAPSSWQFNHTSDPGHLRIFQGGPTGQVTLGTTLNGGAYTTSGRRVWPTQGDIAVDAQISEWFVSSWGSGGGGVTGVPANNPTN